MTAEELTSAYEEFGNKSCFNCEDSNCPKTPEEKIYDPYACNNWCNQQLVENYCQGSKKLIKLLKNKKEQI